MSTLTYVYADSTAVLGPLATYAEPHCYDLCQMHAERLTAPRGWEIVRITPDPDALKPTGDDLEALANAVREAARPRYTPQSQSTAEPAAGAVEVARRGHLRMLTHVEPEPVRSQPDQGSLPERAEQGRSQDFTGQMSDHDDLFTDYQDDDDFDPR